jgi:hypothetical protein
MVAHGEDLRWELYAAHGDKHPKLLEARQRFN